MGSPEDPVHPCLGCGACCATWPVQFHRSEVTPRGDTPRRLVERTGDRDQVVMSGTEGPCPRCDALDGVIGDRTRCSIYPDRPSVCLEVVASFEHGEQDTSCDEARRKYGLPTLTALDWR
jgi:Fe-S-cluster containining protein